MNLLKLLAKSICTIFHPLLMPTYASLLVLNSNFYLSIMNAGIKHKIYFLFFFLSFCLPVSAIILLYIFRLIPSIKATNKKESIIPLAIVSLCYLSCWIILRELNFPVIFTKLFFSATILTSLCLLITRYWKISFHCLGIGGMIGYIFNLSQININVFHYALASIFIAGLIGTSTLFLKTHRETQVYISYIIGFIIIFTFS